MKSRARKNSLRGVCLAAHIVQGRTALFKCFYEAAFAGLSTSPPVPQRLCAPGRCGVRRVGCQKEVSYESPASSLSAESRPLPTYLGYKYQVSDLNNARRPLSRAFISAAPVHHPAVLFAVVHIAIIMPKET
eukprot:3946502-Pleurochrysis_carterae.AAC.5